MSASFQLTLIRWRFSWWCQSDWWYLARDCLSLSWLSYLVLVLFYLFSTDNFSQLINWVQATDWFFVIFLWLRSMSFSLFIHLIITCLYFWETLKSLFWIISKAFHQFPFLYSSILMYYCVSFWGVILPYSIFLLSAPKLVHIWDFLCASLLWDCLFMFRLKVWFLEVRLFCSKECLTLIFEFRCVYCVGPGNNDHHL